MTDKTMTLEPCPFCGGRAKVKTPYVRCVDCGAQMNPPDNELSTAISAWNTRHLSKPAERGEAVAVSQNIARSALSYGFSRGFIAACEWPAPVTQDIYSKAFNDQCEKFVEANAYLYTAPPPAAGVPDGWKLVAVNEHFGDMMYWVERAVTNGHAPDIDESWDAFSWREIPATPSLTIDVAAVRDVIEKLRILPINRKVMGISDLELAKELARAIGDAK